MYLEVQWSLCCVYFFLVSIPFGCDIEMKMNDTGTSADADADADCVDTNDGARKRW